MTPKTILSTKLTSGNIKNSSCAGFIDKLELQVDKDRELTRDYFINHFKSIEHKYECGRFRSGGAYYVKVTTKSLQDIYLVYRYSEPQNIYKIILNPSVFESYNYFMKETTDLIGLSDELKELPISRIDKTIDIASSYQVLERGFIAKFKRATAEFTKDSGYSTGIQVGRNDEVITLYDKSRKAKLNFPCTRLEITQKGSKINIKSLKELSKFWRNPNNLIDPTFNSISLNNVEFSNTGKEREIQLYHGLTFVPYMQARAKLNKCGNFHRDYSSLHTLKPWSTQPKEIFNTGMRIFFNTDEIKEKI